MYTARHTTHTPHRTARPQHRPRTHLLKQRDRRSTEWGCRAGASLIPPWCAGASRLGRHVLAPSQISRWRENRFEIFCCVCRSTWTPPTAAVYDCWSAANNMDAFTAQVLSPDPCRAFPRLVPRWCTRQSGSLMFLETWSPCTNPMNTTIPTRK